MAIRFPCPSCQQPIEIDDQWAGQPVACPYCRRVVSAPRESAWPGEVPMASPAGPPLTGVPGSGPAYLGGQSLPTQSLPAPSPAGPTARTALALALISLFLWLVGAVSFWATVVRIVMQKHGPNPTPEQATELVQEMLRTGGIPVSSFTVGIVLIGLLCAIGALTLGIRSLIRQETRKVAAVTACIIGALFIFCQGMLTLTLFTASMRHAG